MTDRPAGVPVAEAAAGPAASRRQLHTELQRLRRSAGLTQTAVARAQEWSPSKVHRIEKGHVSIGRADLLVLLAHYGITDEAQIAGLLELARRSRSQPMPYRRYRDAFPPETIRFWGHEASASRIDELGLLVVPSLLQTPGYTRALLRHGQGLAEARLRRFLDSRRERQAVLERARPPAVTFLIDETVLARPVGGAAVMRGQLRHLLALAERPHVDIRVLPLALGAHPGLRGPFGVLEFAAANDPDIVYIENRRGESIFESDSAGTGDQRAVFRELERIAAPPDELPAYVERALGALT